MKVFYFDAETDCESIEALNRILVSRDENDYNTFHIGLTETPISNHLVIPFSLAQVVAGDFF